MMQTDFLSSLQPGTVLQGPRNKYVIRKTLGQGSFGITYLATTDMTVTGQMGSFVTTVQVAVKEFFIKELNGREGSAVMAGSQGNYFTDYKRKFLREAESLTKLQHPNVVKALEAFEDNGTAYYAMEYLGGGSLEQVIQKRGALPEAEAMDYVCQIGAALCSMHANHMLHLDVKPANVMLRETGQAVLIDFGLSKQFDEDGNPESSTSMGGGTPGYAPMEQTNYHRGETLPVTMDVYALGATMLKLLTGERPVEASQLFNEGFPTELLAHHGVSSATIAVVKKAMAPARRDRYQSVDELLEAITGQRVEETVMAKPLASNAMSPASDEHVVVASVEPLGNKKKALRKIVVRAAVVVVAMMLGAGLTWWLVGHHSSGVSQEMMMKGDEGRKLYDQGDYVAAIPLLEEAANAGYSDSQLLLGYCKEFGVGVVEDKVEAVKWYRKAAEQGVVAAMCNLATCYYHGTGVKADPEESVVWCRKAANQGSARGQNMLGLRYELGNGVEKDEKEAVDWYRKAAEQGYADAQYNIGDCYEKGTGVAQSIEEAVQWYRKAADNGSVYGQLALGNCYYFGNGVAKNYTEAAILFRKAANQNHAAAQYNLGVCYEYGYGVTKNMQEAVRLYRLAAEQGDKDAQCSLGYCCENGTGTTQNYADAVMWYMKAVEQGDAKAAYYLGVCYYYGRGVDVNKDEAYRLISEAAQKDFSDAKTFINEHTF